MIALVALFPLVAGGVSGVCRAARAAEKESSPEWASSRVTAEMIAGNPATAQAVAGFVTPAEPTVRRGDLLLTPNEAWVLDTQPPGSPQFTRAMAAAMSRRAVGR
jgi:hypothetical protein